MLGAVTNPRNHRAICWGERGALFLLVIYLFVHTMPSAWRGLITDFPNYYMAARLVHEGYDTSRMYEWTWIEREKDHRGVDIRVLGLIPITPISTLAVWPLSGRSPLAAKQVWILLNLAFLPPIAWLLRSMTSLSYQRIALIFALSIPLHRNLLYGQFYVLLLLLIAAACSAYLRGLRAVAGALVGVAAACKMFPVILFVFFLQRRDWRALTWGVVTGLSAAAVSVAVFGWNVHRTYLHEILPWALHGGGLQPYAVSASITAVLHHLFLSEPQWNPHPWHESLRCYAVLLPSLEMLALAPAILLIRRRGSTPDRILLEWSVLLTAALTTSTLAASYNFVVMAFPVCVLAAVLLRDKQHGWLVALLIVYLGIGAPMPTPHTQIGPAVLLYVPRLPLMFALLLGICVLLWRDRAVTDPWWDWTKYVWASAMALSVVFDVSSTFHRERAVRQEYAYRLSLHTQGYLNADAHPTEKGIRYIAFTSNGYHLITDETGIAPAHPYTDSEVDDLSFSSGLGDAANTTLVERVLKPRSVIVDAREPTHILLFNARNPMLSVDGRDLAFVRDDHGRGTLMVRRDFKSGANAIANEVTLTPSPLNVYEASFVSVRDYAFAAVTNGRPPQLYRSDTTHTNAPLPLGESRYPALSPDGRWMAYSHLDDGVWNLWLRDETTGVTRRVADIPCNQIQPAWEQDSKTLLYSTDCGRSLWFTAISRRQVIY
jgi:Glycosyltransferase family 87/WD40-like Beta Propeller Repeat